MREGGIEVLDFYEAVKLGVISIKIKKCMLQWVRIDQKKKWRVPNTDLWGTTGPVPSQQDKETEKGALKFTLY